MKVCILPSWYPTPNFPLSGIFVAEQAQILARRFEVSVLAPQWLGWKETWRGVHMDGLAREEERRVTVFRQRAPIRFPLPPAGYYSYWKAVKTGYQRMQREKGTPDIIHAHVILPAGWAAVKLSRATGIPVVLTEHSGPFSMNLQTRYSRRLVRATLQGFLEILAVSPDLARQISVFRPGLDISALGNVVRTDFFTPAPTDRTGTAEDGFTFLFVGLLTKEKGIPYLIEATRLLLDKGIHDFTVVIAGDGSHRTLLQDLASRIGVDANTKFLGFLDRGDVRAWMRKSDVLVLPSLHETFGIVLGEAMACGKPVIATRCGGPEFVVTAGTGILVEKANPAALAKAMEEFILGRVTVNPEKIRESIVERFGEEAFLDAITGIYDRVLSSSRKGRSRCAG